MHYEQAHAFLVQELLALQMQFPDAQPHIQNTLYRGKKILAGHVQQDINPNQTSIRN